jgi:DNA-directed RNA polymerase subunit RPC12/RpoP
MAEYRCKRCGRHRVRVILCRKTHKIELTCLWCGAKDDEIEKTGRSK